MEGRVCLHGVGPSVADLADFSCLTHQVESQVQIQQMLKQEHRYPPGQHQSSLGNDYFTASNPFNSCMICRALLKGCLTQFETPAPGREGGGQGS